jgi:hypothetical protein
MPLPLMNDAAPRAAFWAAQHRCQALFTRGAYGELTAAYAERDAVLAEQRARRARRAGV